MSKAWSILAKVAVFFAVVLLLSLGLCGMMLVTRSAERLAGAGVVCMIAGGLGLLLCGVAAIVLAVISAIRGGSPPPHPPQ